MARDRVQHLGGHVRLEPTRALLDQAQAQVDVAEEPPLRRRQEERPAVELAGAAGVVQERRGEQDVCSQAWVELRCLAAERRDSHRVLEQASGPRMMGLLGRRQDAEARAEVGVLCGAGDEPRRPGCAISAARNSK